jgi:hypothetical protein
MTIVNDRKPISEAVIRTIISVIFLVVLIATLMIAGPLLSMDFFMTSDNCIGTLKLSASLLRIHYETPVAFIVGIFAELGAVIIMLRQIVNYIIQLAAG